GNVNGVSNLYPTWSPDGDKLAYRGSNYEIEMVIIGSNGQPSAPAAVPNTNGLLSSTGGFSWSPDGTKFVLSASSEIYTINTDGSGLTRLTTNTNNDYAPTWST